MSARMAADCGELLSKTDWPSQTGHANWCSSRSARAVGEGSGRERTMSTTTPTTTTRPSANQGTSLRDFMSALGRGALFAGLGRRQPNVELRLRRRTEIAAHRDTVGGEHIRLGLSGRTEAQRGATVRIDANRPRDVFTLHVVAHRRGVVVDDDADHREVGIRLVLRVERLQRGRLLLARETPAVEEVDDVGLVLQLGGVDRFSVQSVEHERRRVAVLQYQPGHGRLRAVLDREHDAEQHAHDTHYRRDPAGAVLHQVVASTSGAGSESSPFKAITRSSTSRLRGGTRASAQPRAMIKPPIQRNITIV